MGGSSSSSTSSTTNLTRDGRVAGDNGAIGLSVSEGDVGVHIVPDEAFQLGGEAIREIAQLARVVTESGGRATETSQQALSVALEGARAANRSEESQLSEQIVKIGIPAAALAFAVSQIWGK